MNFSNEEFKREMNTFVPWIIIKKKSHYLNIHIPYEYIPISLPFKSYSLQNLFLPFFLPQQYPHLQYSNHSRFSTNSLHIYTTKNTIIKNYYAIIVNLYHYSNQYWIILEQKIPLLKFLPNFLHKYWKFHQKIEESENDQPSQTTANHR